MDCGWRPKPRIQSANQERVPAYDQPRSASSRRPRTSSANRSTGSSSSSATTTRSMSSALYSWTITLRKPGSRSSLADKRRREARVAGECAEGLSVVLERITTPDREISRDVDHELNSFLEWVSSSPRSGGRTAPSPASITSAGPRNRGAVTPRGHRLQPRQSLAPAAAARHPELVADEPSATALQDRRASDPTRRVLRPNSSRRAI